MRLESGDARAVTKDRADKNPRQGTYICHRYRIKKTKKRKKRRKKERKSLRVKVADTAWPTGGGSC